MPFPMKSDTPLPVDTRPAANDEPGRAGGAQRVAVDLTRIPMLADLGTAALEALAQHGHSRPYEAGAVLVDFGDPTDDVFFIIEGSVRVIVRTASGQEVILNDLGAGDFFGELAAIDGAPRSANVTALHRSRVCLVRGAAFLDFTLRTPAFAHRLLRFFSERLRGKDERLLELAVLPVRYRLYAELLRLSREREGGGRIISPPPAHHILAARIGTRREAVSRELSQMSRAGLIVASRRSIVLLQPSVLRAAVDAHLRGDTGN
ncbi:Crp/Fnr family transcriptional regulator [Roseomonas sp. NAR14]|uniref:Crp/Fnr family transcriptional regulator n=1 Tax=Roseomonas acroporae TaxID=2937791 RepID=A0A9X1YCJ8_9PROT|nr:Crp/Fnr family transcriptional regulator [Roseomonas acroporae]MCK8786623.1 Crp/Fnr family transcriptional regulator [Roseomonas acroporae]